MSKERVYSVRFDGHEITQVTLEFDQFKDQRSRDEVRKAIASTYKVPTHYLRLVQIEPSKKYRWNKETEKNERI